MRAASGGPGRSSAVLTLIGADGFTGMRTRLPQPGGGDLHDCVWVVQWIFPSRHDPDVPDSVSDAVRSAAEVMDVVMTDAHSDAHDDAGGGDPDLAVWRFIFRVPALADPRDPADMAHRPVDFWLMDPGTWPAPVAHLAGIIAGLAGPVVGPGRIEASFSPSFTHDAALEDMVWWAYAQELILVEQMLRPYAEEFTELTGRRLPSPILRGYWIRETVIGGVVFYVGEESGGEARGWRYVSAGLDLPPVEGMERAYAMKATDPFLPVPGPDSVLGHPWRLAMGDEQFRGRLPDALRLLMNRLQDLRGA